MNVGETIRKYRKAKDIKAYTVYDLLGISQSTYSKIENNKYKMDIKTLRDIAKTLEVDISKLIVEDKDAPTQVNSINSTEGSTIVGTNNKLIDSLENQIELLKEQNSIFKDTIIRQKDKIRSLKERIKLNNLCKSVG